MNRSLFRGTFALLAAAILFAQLFGEDFTGLANSGDFPRLAGRLSLCPEGGWSANRFSYFVPVYRQAPECDWDSHVPTSALLIVRSARALSSGTLFDIRWLAGVYSACLIFLVALWPPLFLFTDLSNTIYFNSFFLEGSALLGLLGTFAFARFLAIRITVFAQIGFGLFGVLLVTSKIQHAWLAFPMAAFLLLEIRHRSWPVAISLLLSAGAMFSLSPEDSKAANLWNTIFADLLPSAPNPESALQELGLGQKYKQYIGRNAFQFPNAASAAQWTRSVYADSGFPQVATYYLRHPSLAFGRITASARSLRHVRVDYLGNFQAGRGHPPGGQSHRFSFWSDLKIRLYSGHPLMAVCGYCLIGVILYRSRFRPAAMLLICMAAMEFTTSTFADYLEDYRHHALLHQLGDVWICFGLAASFDCVFGQRYSDAVTTQKSERARITLPSWFRARHAATVDQVRS